MLILQLNSTKNITMYKNTVFKGRRKNALNLASEIAHRLNVGAAEVVKTNIFNCSKNSSKPRFPWWPVKNYL